MSNPNITATWLAENGCDDAQTPWWKVALLALPNHSKARFLRDEIERGNWPSKDSDDWRNVWKEIVARARDQIDGTMDEMIAAEPVRCRTGAIRSPRAFCELAGIVDDDLRPVTLKAFHVQLIRGMRERELFLGLVSFGHGKSFLSSIVVPLMDWAENPEATQIRIYASVDAARDWTGKLMAQVEYNEQLRKLFPHIRKPLPSDPCFKIWSTAGFSIGGKQVVDPGWRAFTYGSKRVGFRADRVGMDDVVTEANATSVIEQDKITRYAKTGAMTMRRVRSWPTQGNTKWGTMFVIGTPFDLRDFHSTIKREWQIQIKDGDNTRKVMRVPVYPRLGSRERGEVIWPEHRPAAYVRQLEKDLGREAFRMRCMVSAMDSVHVVFKERDVRGAVRHDHPFGIAPEGSGRLIGFDPGTGSKTKKSKFPAGVLLAWHNDEVHFVRWKRFAGSNPAQCRELVEWSRYHQCPVVVEDNATQRSYKEWISELAPDVRVYSHFTGAVKHSRDDGVEAWVPYFENQKVVIHAGDADEREVEELVSEFTDWPDGRYTDLLMAAWFALYQHKLQTRRPVIREYATNMPAYAQGRGYGRNVIDLRQYR